MQHQASRTEMLRELLKQARFVAAHTIGSAMIMAGSFVARQVVGPLPDGEQPMPPPPPAGAPHGGEPHTAPGPNVKHAA